MRRTIAIVAVFLALAACGQEQAPVNKVGVNVVEKSIFEGSWYMTNVVIDVDYEAAGAGTFPGDTAYDYSTGSGFTLPRIRWAIDEGYLYAYRDYEIIAGADGAPMTEDQQEQLRHPVAVFTILGHFDIKRMYNNTTGEELNVIYEDYQDRPWYERQYMRVDWSTNLVPGYFGQQLRLYELIGYYNREPAPLFVQNESEFPDSWKPQFHRMTCNGLNDQSDGCLAADRDLAGDYAKDELFHMSFVNQELLTPGTLPDPFTGELTNWCITAYTDAPICTSIAAYIRTSFLKVSEERQYEAENWPDSRFERHGYFRLEQLTKDRSSAANDPAYSYTDFLNYAVSRQNIWRQWRDDDGKSIPYAEREVRPVVWYTTPELPAHLVKPSFELVSDWNVTFMNTVRQLRGETLPGYPRVDCQTDEPDGYCACTEDPQTREPINPTCPGRYDPFLSPEQAEEAGVTSPFDCWVEVPDAAEPDGADPAVAARLTDTNFNGWFDAAMHGTECVQLLRLNTCNKATIANNSGSSTGLQCEERGDMRFKFLSYVDQPGTRFLGISTMRSHPITGEILTSDANIGGPALDSYRTSALQQYDLVNGNLTEEEMLTGEDVRGFLQALNNVQLPAPPLVDFSVALAQGLDRPDERAAIDRQMQNAMQRLERLQGAEGMANTYMSRLAALRGTDTERRLTSNVEMLAAAGIDHMPTGASVTEAILDRASPFRHTVLDELSDMSALEERMGAANIHMPNEYIDNSVMEFVTRHADWPRPRLEIAVNRALYYDTQLHELGHCLGLRHDFGASADSGNYYDAYYAINERLPLPDPADYDIDGTPGMSAQESESYREDYEAARERRELAGIDRWMNSSVMEYTANWYERAVAQAGRYDQAAIAAGYGDLIEVYDNTNGLELDEITPINTPRVTMTFYNGGEICGTDADCPYSATSSLLLAANTNSGLTQTCITNPRGASTDEMCSSFDDDVARLAGNDTSPRWAPVSYLFCSDERAAGDTRRPGTIGWCNRFDEGESYREIVRNIEESYDRMYLFSNFRRYRRWPSFGWTGNYYSSLVSRRLMILQSVFQNLAYEYATNPAFRSSTGPLGFYDEFLASTDVLNFYARILGQPDIGSYRWDDGWGRYERVTADPDAIGYNMSIPLGLGKYQYSSYQAGLTGIDRLERIGTFLDKIWTLQLLTLRGYAPAYGRDASFLANFYDVFPLEVTQVVGGIIRGDAEQFMPRIRCADPADAPKCEDPHLVYMDFYRGDCSAGSQTCRPNPTEAAYADMPVLERDPGVSYVQLYAALFGLAGLPVYFDTTFQNQLFMCVEGRGDCHAPTAGATEDEDYVRYTSRARGRTYLAWQIDPVADEEPRQSIGFVMLTEAGRYDALLHVLRKYRGDENDSADDPEYSADNLSAEDLQLLSDLGYEISATRGQVNLEIDRLKTRVRDLDSLFDQLIQFEREYGVL